MGQNTHSDDYDTEQADAYWRRRVVTLAAGLGVLGLLAWAFTGGGGKPAPTSPTPGSWREPGPRSAAAYGWPPNARPTGANGVQASPTMPVLLSPSPSPGAATGSPGAATGSPGASPGGGGLARPQAGAPGPGGRCSPGALVLSLFTSRASYHGGQAPEFEVYAVSIAAGRCVLDLGPGKLTVAVMSSGRLIWDSADCARRDPGRAAELSRGVPAKESIVWNRAITLPGCVTLASAGPGTYQVQARTAGGVSSPVRTFRLVR